MKYLQLPPISIQVSDDFTTHNGLAIDYPKLIEGIITNLHLIDLNSLHDYQIQNLITFIDTFNAKLEQAGFRKV